MATVAAIATVGSLYAANEQRKATIDANRAAENAARIEKRRAEARAMRAAKRAQAQARVQRASITAQALATGGAGSSGLSGAIGSVQSSLYGNQAFHQNDIGFANAAYQANLQASQYQNKAANYGAYSQAAGAVGSIALSQYHPEVVQYGGKSR